MRRSTRVRRRRRAREAPPRAVPARRALLDVAPERLPRHRGLPDRGRRRGGGRDGRARGPARRTRRAAAGREVRADLVGLTRPTSRRCTHGYGRTRAPRRHDRDETPGRRDRWRGAGCRGAGRSCASTSATLAPARIVRGTRRGSVFEALREETGRQGLTDVKVVASGCVEACMVGPVVYVAPDDVWYGGRDGRGRRGARPRPPRRRRRRSSRCASAARSSSSPARRAATSSRRRHPAGAAVSGPTRAARRAHGAAARAARHRAARALACSRSSALGDRCVARRAGRRSALVWGRVTFVDLGLALVFGWLWIAWREASVSPGARVARAHAVTGSGASARLRHDRAVACARHARRARRPSVPGTGAERPSAQLAVLRTTRATTTHPSPQRRVPPVHAPGGRRLSSGASALKREGGRAMKTVGEPSGGRERLVLPERRVAPTWERV
jgi:hypothetical protein